jgi:hypothetical protein
VPSCGAISTPGFALRIAGASARGTSFTNHGKSLTFAITQRRVGATATEPQFVPPALPGYMMDPSSEGGVKIPS